MTTGTPHGDPDRDVVLPETFAVRIAFVSDWHVGLGAGRPGNIDRLVTRDADDLPYVPAKTLKGIWRDACERLAAALDDGNPQGAWSGWVDVLFGSQPALHRGQAWEHEPRPSALTIRAARFSPALRAGLKGDGARPLREALTFVKPGVKIDPRSGRARDQHLRFEERARAGAILEAECALALDGTDEQRRTACALLVAATKLVERLGGKRRRGAGRCTLEVVGREEITPEVKWFTETESPPPPPDNRRQDTAVEHHATGAGEDWVRVPLWLELLEPLAVTAQTVGNVVETLDYLPGTYLLPLVTRALAPLCDVRGAIARGDLRVLPATIEVDGDAGRAVPLALFKHKQGGGFDHPRTVVNRLKEQEDDQPPLKPLREGYIGPAEPGTLPSHTERVPRIIRTHNTVEDEKQRPTADVGGVYSYEAIDVRRTTPRGDVPTRLRSELRLRGSLARALADGWQKRLEGTCRLGRSKKDDYGLVAISVADVTPLESTGSPSLGDELVVWLLSDVLLRDDRLRPDPTPDGLAKELGRALSPEGSQRVELEPSGARDGCLAAVVRTRRIESWNVDWGLPRPSLVAMAAGSCVVFKVVKGQPDPGRLRAVEAGGIGERRAEGYGQVCFNDPLLMGSLKDWQSPPRHEDPRGEPPEPPAIGPDDEDAAFATLIEAEAWREAIRRGALAVAARAEDRERHLGLRLDPDHPDRSRPTMSQLGALRMMLQRLRSRDDSERILTWLDRLEKWPKETRDRVRALIQDERQVWQILPAVETWPTLTSGADGRLERALWAEAVRAVVDASIRAHKRELERTGEV